MTNQEKIYLKNEVLTTEEASQYSGIHPRTLTRKVIRGDIDAVKKGKNTLLFIKKDLTN